MKNKLDEPVEIYFATGAEYIELKRKAEAYPMLVEFVRGDPDKPIPSIEAYKILKELGELK